MPLTPKEILDINDLIDEKIVGANLHLKSSESTTRDVTVKKASSGLMGMGSITEIIAALHSLTRPTKDYVVTPALQDRINDIKEILDFPEDYVENPANYKQFKDIIIDRIKSKITELKNLAPEEQLALSEEQKAIREERKRTKELVENAAPPKQGDARATMMLSDDEYAIQLSAEWDTEDALPMVPMEEIRGTDQALLRLVITNQSLRTLISTNALPFRKAKELYEESPEKLHELSYPNILTLTRLRMPFANLEALYNTNPDNIYLITQPGVVKLIREEFISWNKAEEFCYNEPDKLDFLAHHNSIRFMKDFDISFNRAATMYDESKEKFKAISHPFTQNLMRDHNISLDVVCDIYDKSPKKLEALSAPNVSRLILLAGFDKINAIYDYKPTIVRNMARKNLQFTQSTLTAHCDEILTRRDEIERRRNIPRDDRVRRREPNTDLDERPEPRNHAADEMDTDSNFRTTRFANRHSRQNDGDSGQEQGNQSFQDRLRNHGHNNTGRNR